MGGSGAECPGELSALLSPAPQHDGLVWPSEPSRVSRAVPEVRLGSVSLIPLRGSENEMRRSVAAFTADPLSVSGFPSLWAEGWDLEGVLLPPLLIALWPPPSILQPILAGSVGGAPSLPCPGDPS